MFKNNLQRILMDIKMIFLDKNDIILIFARTLIV